MTDLEEEIKTMKTDIALDENRIKTFKDAVWKKKKNLKNMEETLRIIKGNEESEAIEDEMPEIRTVI